MSQACLHTVKFPTPPPSIPHKNQTIPWEIQKQTTTRSTEPSSSSVLGFPGGKSGLLENIKYSFAITMSLVALLFLSDMDVLSGSKGCK